MVRDATTDDNVWWDNNKSMHAGAVRDAARRLPHACRRQDLFAQDLYGGADPTYRVKTRVFTEFAWHSLFIRNLLIRPDAPELAGFVPELTIVDLPSFKADPKRHGCRTETVDRDRLHPQDRPDRRHVLCRRDEEVGLHLL